MISKSTITYILLIIIGIILLYWRNDIESKVGFKSTYGILTGIVFILLGGYMAYRNMMKNKDENEEIEKVNNE
jgi:sulfite exporter TauE/SafE